MIRRPPRSTPLSLHDALPISGDLGEGAYEPATNWSPTLTPRRPASPAGISNTAFAPRLPADRKSTRLNSSHSQISYAVFCLKKKHNAVTITYLFTNILTP